MNKSGQVMIGSDTVELGSNRLRSVLETESATLYGSPTPRIHSPLRLPFVRLGSLRFSLSFPDTPALLPFLCVPFPACHIGWKPPYDTKALVHPVPLLFWRSWGGDIWLSQVPELSL